MSLAHARALLPPDEIHVVEFKAARDQQRLKSLASWAIRFSPIVSPDPPDGLLLDVTGCQRVHHGERRLVNGIANSLEWLGFRAHVACASTFACTWGVARYGGHERFIVAAGDELTALRDLPIEALRLETDTIDALHEVNIDRVGHLTCLPRNDLAARFGRGLLLKLDQALGVSAVEESIEPTRSIMLPRVERVFDGPVKQIEGILLATQELVAQLCDRMHELESGVRRLDLDLERIDTVNLRETIMLSRPSRDPRHLWSLLRPRAEQINLGFGVDKIALTAMRTSRLPHAQTERWREGVGGDDSADERAAGELIDTLASRLGPERIVCAKPMESHVAERAFRHEPVMTGEQSADRVLDGATTVKCVDRPTILFDKPESIDVLAVTPEGPPKWMRWRGQEHTITASSGPERIAEEWWQGGRLAGGVLAAAPSCLAARDYFRVQLDNGTWLWVYRQREGERCGERGGWFVHGEWA